MERAGPWMYPSVSNDTTIAASTTGRSATNREILRHRGRRLGRADGGEMMVTSNSIGTSNEVDSGMRFLLKSDDLKTTYAIIYTPPDRDPPSGFTSGYIYYYVEQELPSSGTDLKLVSDDQPPGFAASDAISSPTVGYTDQGSAPARSDTLWVYRVEQSWAIDWKLRGTGTNATGSVTFWNETGAALSLRVGTYPIANDTSVTANTTYSATDQPTASS